MIHIETLKEEHLERRVDLLNNPEISHYLNINEKFSIENTKDWFVNRNIDKRYDCVFMDDDHIIGMGGLSNISKQDQRAELYMYLSSQYQGLGLGYKSLRALCEYGFKILNLNKIFLYTFSYNIRANGLYEKLGFKLEGILRKHTLKDGVLQDRFIYGLLKTEYKTK